MGSVLKENSVIRGPGVTIVNVQINYDTPEDDFANDSSQYWPGKSQNAPSSPLLTKKSF